MQLVSSNSKISYDKNTIITIGTFDGVHLGHQKIINAMIDEAKKRSLRSVLITFDPHPREVVGRGPTKLLTTLDERVELLSEYPLDYIYVIGFTFEFSRLPYDEFYKNYIHDKIGVKEVIVGHNHMFGRDREAAFEQLKELGKRFDFEVRMINAVMVGDETVSSSKIRDIIFRGDVCRAEKYLGRFYSMKGFVVEGDGRGKALGYPTANIKPISEKKLIPAEGVYFVSAIINEKSYFGMMNIGIRPTFNTEHKKVIEVHLFDFNKEVYGKEIKILFHNRLRSEKKFVTESELIEQLKLDKSKCEEYIQAINKN